jgi:hypothetical protein
MASMRQHKSWSGEKPYNLCFVIDSLRRGIRPAGKSDFTELTSVPLEAECAVVNVHVGSHDVTGSVDAEGQSLCRVSVRNFDDSEYLAVQSIAASTVVLTVSVKADNLSGIIDTVCRDGKRSGIVDARKLSIDQVEAVGYKIAIIVIADDFPVVIDSQCKGVHCTRLVYLCVLPVGEQKSVPHAIRIVKPAHHFIAGIYPLRICTPSSRKCDWSVSEC